MRTPRPLHERYRRAAQFPGHVFFLLLGGMSFRGACRRFHVWVWYD